MSATATRAPVRMHRLTVENFMRLQAVDVRMDDRGNLVQITGWNDQGKSSFLDAIQAALGGTAACPEKPIRNGQSRASVTIDLGDLIVERRWSEGRSSLTVRSQDGAKYPTPQAILDELVGRLTFDPIAFQKMRPKDQAETLRSLAGLDFSDLDSRRSDLYQQRTLVNRDLKSAEARLAAFPVDPYPPAGPVSVQGLAAEYRMAAAFIKESDALRHKAAQINREVLVADAKVEALRLKLQEATSDRDRLAAAAQEADLIAGNRVDPDLASLEKALGDAEATNKRVEANRQRASVCGEVEGLRERAEDLTARIEAVDGERAGRLAEARFPVEGLDLDTASDTVLFRGIPLSQASQSQRLRVSLAIASALNPTLRLVLVRDTPMLDPTTMQALESWADEQDIQILLERVADPEEGIGIVIEDGRIKGENPF